MLAMSSNIAKLLTLLFLYLFIYKKNHKCRDKLCESLSVAVCVYVCCVRHVYAHVFTTCIDRSEGFKKTSRRPLVKFYRFLFQSSRRFRSLKTFEYFAKLTFLESGLFF